MEDARRIDEQHANEIVMALPVELTREQNIMLVREFVRDHITPRGFVADWVLHDKGDGNPHAHLTHTLRPLTDEGFGRKTMPVLGEDGQAVRVNGKIVYRQFAGGRELVQQLRTAWGDVVNTHLARAGLDFHIDMRSYAERGFDVTPGIHLGPSASAIVRRQESSSAFAAREAERFAMADKFLERPEELLRLIASQQSTFTREDIAKTLHRYVDDPEIYPTALARVMASKELVALDGTSFATRETIRQEHEMAQAVDRMLAAGGFGVDERKVRRIIEQVEAKKGFRLADEQRAAVLHVTRRNGIASVVGIAGAGKSTLMEAAHEAWKAHGRRVFGAALAGKAAEGLQESSGIQSRTLASWELAWAKDRGLLQKGDIFVIDEAGMVSSAQMARVVAEVEGRGAKVVLVGDAMQLQPIEAGAAFRSITDRTGFALLEDVRRQKEAWAQEATRSFARGDTRDALDAYRSRGFVRELESGEGAIGAIIADWWMARDAKAAATAGEGRALRGDELLVLAHRNDDVRAINDGIRAGMVERDLLGAQSEFQTARGIRQFAAGDRIVFLANSRLDGVAPGQRHEVKNGRLGTVVDARRDELRVRLDGSGVEVMVRAAEYAHVDHGYAATVHKSQGATVDQVLVLATRGMDQHLSYVAMSRHREAATMYASRTEFEDFDALAERLGRSGAKTTTLNFENTDGYRQAVSAFARFRFLDMAEEFLACFLPGLARDRASIQVPAESAAAAAARPGVPASAAGPAAIEGKHAWETTIEQAARERVRGRDAWQHREAALSDALATVYRDPGAALEHIRGLIEGGASPRALAASLMSSPERLGEQDLQAAPPRPKLSVKPMKRSERREALSQAATLTRSLGELWRRELPVATTAETRNREAAAVAIPELSERAARRLAELGAAVRGGGDAVWFQAARSAAADAAVAAEVRALDAALTARFGWRAFGPRQDEETERRIDARTKVGDRIRIGAQAVSTEVAMDGTIRGGRDRTLLESLTLEETWQMGRRLAGHMHFAERQEARLGAIEDKMLDAAAGAQDKALDAAAVVASREKRRQDGTQAPGLAGGEPSAADPGPLFRAVTRFERPVDLLAGEAAEADPQFQRAMRQFAEAAAKVWRDPVAASQAALSMVRGGEGAQAVERALQADPEVLGTLRGGTRLRDRLGSGAAERRAALFDLAEAQKVLQQAADRYASKLSQVVDQESGRRAQMGREVFRPSDALTAELRAMERLRGQDYEAFLARAKGLEPDKVDELKRLGAALTGRFGEKALRPGADVAQAAGLVQEVGRERLARLHELLVTAIDATKVVEGGRSKAEEALAARAAREAMLRAETPDARAERQVREAETTRVGEAKAQATEKGPKLGL
ncbi:MAG: Ti-type conjugative transfer relaxase TraA [Inquilinus sp.]|uniref:Ti-type conjugative transfer relaxase TraA n=1 Tax=Inquilinus sp. TaxID=1932117 RepID=UPI003F3FDB22